jgi:peptidyl-prolyl cis-trans isomerase D
MTAAVYEMKLKNNVLQKQLFTYISSGAKSPVFFVEEYFTEKNSKLTVDFIDLNRFYKTKEKFSNEDLIKFVNDNSDKLKQEHIDFSYIIISPKILTGSDEFDQTFFNKIDEIENQISKNVDFKSIANDLKISPTIKKDYINLLNKNTIENIIYNSRKNTTEIIEYEGTYILYNIDQINEKLASLNDERFKKQISSVLYKKEKYEFNKKILDQINKKEFNQASFNKLGNNNIQNIKIESKDDDSKFEKNSVEILYSMPLNTFTLVSDYNDNIFVAKTVKYEKPSFSKNSKNYNAISNEASSENRNTILKSFDYLLNDKYKVVINEKTLERVKNYFR